MASIVPLLWFLFFALIGLWLLVKWRPQRDDLVHDILSISESQIGREVNALIREEMERRAKRNWLERFEERIRQTQTGITLPIYLLILAGAVVVVFIAVQLILNVLVVSVVLSVAGAFVPHMLINYLRNKNIDFFDVQLSPVLRRMSSFLRSGASLKQALLDVSEAVSVPVKVRQQFKTVLQQIEAGQELEPALFALYERIGSENLLFFSVSVDVLRKQGADLPEVFDTISQNISAKNISQRRVRSILSQLKASSNLLSIMPFVLMGILTLMNPTYFQPLFSTMGGRILMFGVFAMMVIGYFVFRKFSKIE